MPVGRYFLDEPLRIGETHSLSGREFHHLHRVVRTHVGDEIELVNGRGEGAVATILSIEKSEAHLLIRNRFQQEVDTRPLILLQAIPKGGKVDFIVEKGTELGASAIWFFASDKSIREFISKGQEERMRALAVAAMKQSGRLFLPKIQIFPSLDKVLDGVQRSLFFGDLSEDPKLLISLFLQGGISFPLHFAIGPESGWSQQEREILTSRGGIPTQLSAATLRTETAAIAAIALAAHFILARSE